MKMSPGGWTAAKDRRRNKCRLSLRKRRGFRGAKGDNTTVIDAPAPKGQSACSGSVPSRDCGKS